MGVTHCFDNNGKCFGFLRKDRTISMNPDNELDKLMAFKRKKDTSEIVLQINLGHMLLPNGCAYRVTAVRG